MKGNGLRPGDELRIPRCQQTRKRVSKHSPDALVTHTVRAGDTLGKIARQYDSSVVAIKSRNRLEGHMIRPGQVLAITPGLGGKGRPLAGQSVGRPQKGRLKNATRLPQSRAYYRRRLKRTWGTNYVVHHIRRAAELVAKRQPRAHRLAIGDISARKGGPISQHVSHQSGRDVDLGFYFSKRPAGYPKTFVKATAKNLNFDANWTLLTSLAATKGGDGGVEAMYISYDVQKILYKAAKARGVSKKTLSRVLQYPRGRDALAGIVRHEPGHDDHVHVRFSCPKSDKSCR